MARVKLPENVWGIFGETLKIYMSEFFKFTGYMAFPVLGQLVGIIWVFASTFVLTDNFEYLVAKFPAINDFGSFMLAALLIALPGLLLFLGAFWQYLIAYGSLNSMTEGVLTTGRVYDFASHKEVITRRTSQYIILWLVYSIFLALASFPLLWVLGGIFFIYFILIFQAFTFAEGSELPVGGYFRKSFDLIRGNFAQTIAISLLLVVVCFYLLPMGLNVILGALNLNEFFTGAILPFVQNLPLESVNQPLTSFGADAITPDLLAKSILEQIVFFIAFGFTLPLRSVCWTLWYKSLDNRKEKKPSKKSGR